MTDTQETPSDFIRDIVREDFASGRLQADQEQGQTLVTRFPPEPNGYLHIGHAKAICLNFGLVQEFGGRCHLRFDDTNPSKEEQEYADAIMNDVRWLGFDWGEHLYHASDYFEQLYLWGEHLIESGDAYIDEQTYEVMRSQRGSLTEPGTDSPHRDRPREESLDLFRRMRAGDFPDGAMVLRARIDMSSPNLNLRDPVLYRIQHKDHPRTGSAWCIYPMYDFAHGQSDAIEGISHSLCTLEFENHRPLYDWFLEKLPVPAKPRQIEFSRLNLSYTITSKRKLASLLEHGVVDGWDDPRMPTIAGMRRRGVTPQSIRTLCKTVGITKTEGIVDHALFDAIQREELNESAHRRMAVLRPLKVVVENWPEGKVEMVEAQNHPGRPELGTREVPFSGELWIEQDDFRVEAPRKYFRLKPGQEVRFRYGYYLTCTGYETNEAGEVTLVRCTYDPESRGGNTADERRVKGTIHWVDAQSSVPAEVRLYDHLFQQPDPSAGDDLMAAVNPNSLETVTAQLEPALAEEAVPGAVAVQFERNGYFCPDTTSSAGAAIFNRIVALRDSWAKFEKNMAGGATSA